MVGEVAAMLQQKVLNDVTALGDSDVQKFYNNSVVFLTGGSGFLGKQLIEKLLRSCRISKVFMLLRPKKKTNIQERLEDVLNDPVFDSLRKQQPEFKSKIVAIEGDVAEIKLGINKDDWEILTEEIDVMFHVAATTRLDETLQLATLINVRGTREALLLGKTCKKLRSYVHVSTAYSHATTSNIGKEVKEEFYEVAIPPEAMISMAESMNAERLKSITKQIIKDWRNTYVFTKSLSEELVRTTSVGLPICIVRPGIVICTYNEPRPGWLDYSCVYGPSGIFVSIGLGIMHTLYVKPDTKIGLIPCDYVNNAIIVAGRETATNQAKGGMDTKIYTVASPQRNPVTYNKLQDMIVSTCRSFVSPSAIYHVCMFDTSNERMFRIQSAFFHFLPAHIADLVCFFLGKERKFVKTAKKMYKTSNVLSFFLLNDWRFVDDNLNKLYNKLSNHDKIMYNFDVKNINWDYCMTIWWNGIRKYIIKDTVKDKDYTINKQNYLRILHYLTMTTFLYSLWKIVYFVNCIRRRLFVKVK